jgi:hypothetical protein
MPASAHLSTLSSPPKIKEQWLDKALAAYDRETKLDVGEM